MAQPTPPKQPNIFKLLVPYRSLIAMLIVLALASNALTLWLPRLMSHGIDGFFRNGSVNAVLWQFGIASAAIFIFTYLQSIVQTYASERVAKDIRNQVSEKIAIHSYSDIQNLTPAKLLTNLTSDIDAIKNFVAQAIVNIVSSLFIIIGASILLISINWKLGLAVLTIIPIIGGTFFVVLGKVRALFLKTREIIDWLNKVINESILGAPLIRVLNSQTLEHNKFNSANTNARDIGTSILKLFSAMIPVITFSANLAVLIILVLGGKFVIAGTMTIGEFTSFNGYLAILIFPILIIGFMSNIIAAAQASYGRIEEVLKLPQPADDGTLTTPLTGAMALQRVTLTYGEKAVLKHISLDIKPGSKVAIIGPTAAGKTQLLQLLVGLIQPNEGTILFDGHPLTEYRRENLYQQIGLVFQDSIIFSMSLRENIAFNTNVTDAALKKAIETAELDEFITTLPQGMETIVSERGTSLSGGQKQRIMLARALAIEPKIVLLDDFTARVDTATERSILTNIAKNYPDLTLVSVTQKIASVEHYDQLIVLMEGELIATGTHEHLLSTSAEYAQIYHSQQSTSSYELQPQ